MSQSIELPLDTKCYLCDSYYVNVCQSFIIYKCFKCKNCTPYCASCEIKLQKLFGKGNFFKCIHCDKLANAEDKIEVAPSKNNLYENSNLNSFYKTPSKPFMVNNIPISSIRQSNNSNNYFFKANNAEEERKNNGNERNNNNDNSPSDNNKIMLSHFLNDFNKMNINFSLKNISNNNNISNGTSYNNKNYLNNNTTVNNSNRNINISDISREVNNPTSISNYPKNDMNDFSLLTSRNRLNKRFCLNESLLGKKRDESANNNEFRGLRQNSKINIRNPSKGKFRNLISMKMSKVYNNDEMSNNNANNFGLNLLRDKSRNKDVKNNIFANHQRSITLSFIDGKSTPHRLSNNSFEYF